MSLTKKNEYATSDFDGVNTQALRQAIKSGQQAWLENIQPIGPANAKVIPNCNADPLCTIGEAPYYAQGFNIIITLIARDILLIATTAGNIWYVDCASPTVTTQISTGGNAGKFTKCSAAQWKNERLIIVDEVSGVWSWDGTTLTQAGFNTPPSGGQVIATFSGSVWIAQNRTVWFTAPNDYLDFRTASGGGSIVLTDENLHSSITQLLTSNNFLYVFGVDSVNVFSDVRVSGGSRVLTNTNLSTGVGTSFPLSVLTYQRSVWFASANGYYALYGASAKKQSTELDGMYKNIQNILSPAASGATPTMSGGLVSLNNILCAAWVFRYNDPLTTTRSLLAMYFDGKWFFASQGTQNWAVATDCVVRGQNKLYGLTTTGQLYQFFSNTLTPVSYQWKSALWDFQQPVQYKQVVKVGFGVYFEYDTGNVVTTVDTETNSSGSVVFSGSGSITFVGSGPIVFSGTGPITWTSGGYNLMQSDATNFGRYVGFTVTGDSRPATFTLAMMEYNYRSQWGT